MRRQFGSAAGWFRRQALAMFAACGVSAVAVGFATVSDCRAGENYAFLASVKEYDEKELRPLQFTRNDVLEFHRTLLDSGFREANIVLMHDDVRRLENRKYLPEAEKIRQQLGLLLGAVDEGDTVVVALAGHGVQFRGDDQSYFCPADAKLADKSTLISFQQLYAALRECRATRKLLLVDACRNDPQSALSRARATIDLESVTRPQKEAVPEGIAALFSCSPGQQSYEHPALQHGIFFHHVLKAWNGEADNDRDGRVTFDELAGYVKRETSTYARRQLDVLQTPHLKSDASGDWVLRTVASALSDAKPLPPAQIPADAKGDGSKVFGSADGKGAFASRAKDDIQYFGKGQGAPGNPQLAERIKAAQEEYDAAEQRRLTEHELALKGSGSKERVVAAEQAAFDAKDKLNRLVSEHEIAIKEGLVNSTPPAATPGAGVVLGTDLPPKGASKQRGKTASRKGFRPPELVKLDAAHAAARKAFEAAKIERIRLQIAYQKGGVEPYRIEEAKKAESDAAGAANRILDDIRELETKLGL